MNGQNPQLPARGNGENQQKFFQNLFPGPSSGVQGGAAGQQQYAPPPMPQQAPPAQPPLPPGWISQWNVEYSRYFYVNTSTGQSQWEVPVIQYAPPPMPPPPSNTTAAMPPPTSNYTTMPAAMAAPVNVGVQQHSPQSTPTPQSAVMGQATTADPVKAAFLPAQQVSSFGTEMAFNAHAPSMGLAETVDPTVAIALELKQSIPALRAGPPPDSKQPIKDAWRQYLREIQDYQNQHTRRVRDAQVEHQKQVQDADYYSKRNLQNQASYGFSALPFGSSGGSGSLFSAASSLFNRGTQFTQQRDEYNKRLSDAKTTYERNVEHSAQNLNDSVENANRRYDDVIYELSKPAA